jgi:hypothetical protein
MSTVRIPDGDVLTVELPGLAAVRIDAATRTIAVDGISGSAEGPLGADWAISDLRFGTYGDFHRLLPAGQCHDTACAASGQHAPPILAVPGDGGTCLPEEPPTGSVVAIDWGGSHQEVWVSNQANIGNWYTPDLPLPGDAHPTWEDVKRRAQGRTMTLLVAGSRDTYAIGHDAGVTATAAAVERAIEAARDSLAAHDGGR